MVSRARLVRSGQASVEMTVAFFCAMLLLFACLKVFLWLNERIVRRQINYDNTRIGAAASDAKGAQGKEGFWNEPKKKLRVLNEQ